MLDVLIFGQPTTLPQRVHLPRTLLVGCMLLARGLLCAQSTTADHLNTWLVYTGNHRLSDRWGFFTEYQPRRHDGLEHVQQSLTRVAIDHYLKAGPTVSAGYGWIVSHPYGEQPIAYDFHEHRIWEQFLLTQQVGRLQIQHRYRLEQRFMEVKTLEANGDWSPDGFQLKQRARYRLLVNVPLTRKEMADNTLFLSVWDEVFGQFGRHVGANVMDQNRLYGGLGWRANANVNVQVGYLNQYLMKSDGRHAERNHTVQVALNWNLDFRSSAK